MDDSAAIRRAFPVRSTGIVLILGPGTLVNGDGITLETSVAPSPPTGNRRERRAEQARRRRRG